MAQVTLKTGFDVDYYLDQVGADYYLTAAGEPPGVWAGTAAAGLGLSGVVDPDVMRALYHHDAGPGGEMLGTSQRGPRYAARASYQMVQEAIARRVAELGSFGTPEEVRRIGREERAKTRTRTPYYDMTFSAEKSVSLYHAGLRAAASAARAGGDEREAERLEAAGRSVEAAVMAGADAMLGTVERRGAVIRTGHHSAHSGEFRDAAGFVAVKFLQHTSRSDDPQLHVQVPILNRAQRADGADEKWRALDGRPLWQERLAAAAYGGAAEAQALARLGLPLVKRADGNGFEVGGIDAETMGAFSARAAAISDRLAELIADYAMTYGRQPDRRALFLLRKRVTVETRAVKHKPPAGEQDDEQARAGRAEAELAGWISKAADANVQELDALPRAVTEYAAGHRGARPEQMPDQAERAQVMRAAVAEVQAANAAWTRAQLEWELYRQLPVLPADADWGAYLSAMADDVLAGRAGSGADDPVVIQIAPVPDVVDVSRLGERKDGTSIYRPPGEARYVTREHLNLEEWVLSAALYPVRQLMDEEEADEVLAGSDLDFSQRQAARGMLTTGRLVTCLVAPAGTGKTHAMAAYARAWGQVTGRRVIGLTMSENAARVMAGEGMSEAHNIARFFARRVPVSRDDVLVVDEATQVSTTDLARIMNLAQQAGARVLLVMDTEQLGPVEAGGMPALIAAEHGHWKLTEVRRFTEAWEARASLKLRDGLLEAWHDYDRQGRVRHGPADHARDWAVRMYLADTRNGKTSLLLAGSNEEAAQLARMVRDMRIENGHIQGGRDVTLADRNPATAGDLVRVRLNSEIDAAGRRLTNRDTLQIIGWAGAGESRVAVAVRETAPGEWSREFTVPAAYLEQHAELAYAGNVYVAQGRTVDTAHLVVSEGMTRDMLYVGMTRGRESNTAHVVTGRPDPALPTPEEHVRTGQEWAARSRAVIDAGGDYKDAGRIAGPPPMLEPEPGSQAPWEAVIAAAMTKDDPLVTALEQLRAAQDFPAHSRHLFELTEAFWWKDTVPLIDQAVRDRIPADSYQRYLTDPERPALLNELRAHEIGGRSIEDSLDAICGRGFDGARSIAGVLHGRLGKGPAPVRGSTATWADRAPRRTSDADRDARRSLDQRQQVLGEQLAARPPRWAVQAWGAPPAEPGRLREDWVRRAAIVGSYREACGITDPAQAIAPIPSGSPQLSEAYTASVRALELPDDQALLQAMGRGQLEAQVRQYERAAALAPPDVTPELGHARWEHDRQAVPGHDPDKTTRLQELQVSDAARREWEEAIAQQAETARQARDELTRRGPAGTAATEAAPAAADRSLPCGLAGGDVMLDAQEQAELSVICARVDALNERRAARQGAVDQAGIDEPLSTYTDVAAEATLDAAWESGNQLWPTPDLVHEADDAELGI